MDYLAINSVLPKGNTNVMRYASRSDLVKKEFAAIFYKELLKQAFESQSASFSEDKNNLMTNAINQDILIDKLAEELALKNMNLLE